MQLTSKMYETIENSLENYANFAELFYNSEQSGYMPEDGKTSLFYKSQEVCTNIYNALTKNGEELEIPFDGMTVPGHLEMTERVLDEETGQKICVLELKLEDAFLEEPVALVSPILNSELVQDQANTIASTLDASYASKEQLQWRDFVESFKEDFYRGTPLEKMLDGLKEMYEALRETKDQMEVERREWVDNTKDSLNEKKEWVKNTAVSIKEGIQAGVDIMKDSYESSKMEAEINASIRRQHAAENKEAFKATMGKLAEGAHIAYDGWKKSVKGPMNLRDKTPLGALATIAYRAASEALIISGEIAKTFVKANVNAISNAAKYVLASPEKREEIYNERMFEIGEKLDKAEDFIMNTVPDKAAALAEKATEGGKALAGKALEGASNLADKANKFAFKIADAVYTKVEESEVGKKAKNLLLDLAHGKVGTYIGDKITDCLEGSFEVEKLLDRRTNLDARINADTPAMAKLSGVMQGLIVDSVSAPRLDSETNKSIVEVVLQAPIRPELKDIGKCYRNALLHDDKKADGKNDPTLVKAFIVDGKLDMDTCVAYSSERQLRAGEGQVVSLNPSITKEPEVAKAFEKIVVAKAEQVYNAGKENGPSFAEAMNEVKAEQKANNEAYAQNFNLLDVSGHECKGGYDVYTLSVPEVLTNTSHQNDTFDSIIKANDSIVQNIYRANKNTNLPPVLKVTMDEGRVVNAHVVLQDGLATNMEIKVPQEAAQNICRQVNAWVKDNPVAEAAEVKTNQAMIEDLIAQLNTVSQAAPEVPHVEHVQEQTASMEQAADFSSIMDQLRNAVEQTSVEKSSAEKSKNQIEHDDI